MKRTCFERRRKIVITGGHLTPALAVINKLKKDDQWEVLFIGRKRTMEGDLAVSIESQLIPALGINFVSLEAGRVPRTTTRFSLSAILKIPLGFFQSFYYLWRFRPDVILSFGGYLAVPVVLISWLMRIPIVTHEQSVKPGLANKLIGRLACQIAISWKESEAFFPKRKTIFIGNPIRDEILKLFCSPFKKTSSFPLIYITGGNQGAHAINEVIAQSLTLLLKRYRLIHQIGSNTFFQDDKKLQTLVAKLPPDLRGRYRLGRWFNGQQLAKILIQADLIISRAGANTIFELACLGKPAILIPFPFLKEQEENAQALAKFGLVEILPQKELTGQKLLKLIEKMLGQQSRYQKNGQKAKSLIKKDAADKLVEVVRRCAG